jgi:hypothetical protein
VAEPVRSEGRNEPSDRSGGREQRARERYHDLIDRFDDDIGPGPEEVDAWAARERRRRQEWVSGPSERDRLMWARRERMRRLGHGMFAEGRSRDESRFRACRSGRELQVAAQGAAVELLSFPFRLFDLLVESGRQSERPTGRPSDFDDDLD